MNNRNLKFPLCHFRIYMKKTQIFQNLSDVKKRKGTMTTIGIFNILFLNLNVIILVIILLALLKAYMSIMFDWCYFSDIQNIVNDSHSLLKNISFVKIGEENIINSNNPISDAITGTPSENKASYWGVGLFIVTSVIIISVTLYFSGKLDPIIEVLKPTAKNIVDASESTISQAESKDSSDLIKSLRETNETDVLTHYQNLKPYIKKAVEQNKEYFEELRKTHEVLPPTIPQDSPAEDPAEDILPEIDWVKIAEKALSVSDVAGGMDWVAQFMRLRVPNIEVYVQIVNWIDLVTKTPIDPETIDLLYSWKTLILTFIQNMG